MAIVVLDQQVRIGSFDSSSIPFPLDPISGQPLLNPLTGQAYQAVDMSSTMSDADALDTTKRCLLYIRVSYDGVSYIGDPAWTNEWSGGLDKHGNPRVPNFGVSMQPDSQGRWPQRAMVQIDTEGFSLNMGVILSIS